MITAKVVDLRGFTGHLRRFQRELDGAARDGLRASAEKTADRARGKAPRRTGRLASSINVRESADEIQVVAEEPYAIYQKPFLLVSADEDEALREVAQEFDQLVRRHWRG